MAQEKEFDITSEELHKLEEALKKEEFRKLLVDYAKEIRDPDNRKKYEEEITQLERERGQDIKFLTFEPGFVVKTKSKDNCKVFINVCQSDIVAKATTTPGQRSDGKGDHWSIPYSLTTVREDVDHAGSKCNVVDFVVHPYTYDLGQKNMRFKVMLVDTAFDGIQEKRGLKLDRKVLRYLKMPYKGTPTQNIIRKPLDDKEASASAQQEEDKLPFTIPYPPLNTEQAASSNVVTNSDDGTTKTAAPVTPKYTITHRGQMELQDYTTDSSFVRSTRPKQLIITIDLSGLESANDVELDYDSSSLDLYCPTPPYRLQIKLPYKVNEDEGSAKFEKAKQHLVVTLSVLPMKTTVVNVDMNNETQKSNTQNISEEASQQGETIIGVCAKIQDHDESVSESVKPCDPEAHHGNAENLLSVVSHEPLRCPAYTYHQTTDNVTFILHVPVVKETTLVKSFEPQQFTLAFTTKEAIQYSFAVVLPEGCVLDITKCSIDVSSDNVVVMAAKCESCCTTWQHFRAGISLVDTQEKQFLTEENVSELCAVSNSHTHSGTESGAGQLQASVTELSDELITISVDQPHPPTDKEEHSTSLSCNEPHPSPSPCDKLSPSSHDPSKPHSSVYRDDSTPPIEEPAKDQQPFPSHESISGPPSQTTANLEPHSHNVTEDPSPDKKTSVSKDQPLLVPTNQLLFELD